MFSDANLAAARALAVCALPLFVCPIAGVADPLATATVAVRQTVQCCYREGAMSYVIVHQVGNDHATSRVSRLLAPLDPTLLFQAELDPGVYQIGSFQRPCDGNCDFLDAPVDQCNSGPIELQAGAVVNLLVSVVPFGGCTYSIEDAGA